MVGINAMINFFYDHRVALWKPGIVEPCPVVIKSTRLNNKGIVIDPFPCRITPPPRFWRARILDSYPRRLFRVRRHLSTIRPDRAKFLLILIENHYMGRRLENFARSEIMQSRSRPTFRVTPAQQRIIIS